MRAGILAKAVLGYVPGIQKHYSNATLHLAGADFAATALVGLFQGLGDAVAAVAAAEQQRADAVKAAAAELAKVQPVAKAFRQTVMAAFSQGRRPSWAGLLARAGEEARPQRGGEGRGGGRRRRPRRGRRWARRELPRRRPRRRRSPLRRWSLRLRLRRPRRLRRRRRPHRRRPRSPDLRRVGTRVSAAPRGRGTASATPAANCASAVSRPRTRPDPSGTGPTPGIVGKTGGPSTASQLLLEASYSHDCRGLVLPPPNAVELLTAGPSSAQLRAMAEYVRTSGWSSPMKTSRPSAQSSAPPGRGLVRQRRARRCSNGVSRTRSRSSRPRASSPARDRPRCGPRRVVAGPSSPARLPPGVLHGGTHYRG